MTDPAHSLEVDAAQARRGQDYTGASGYRHLVGVATFQQPTSINE